MASENHRNDSTQDQLNDESTSFASKFVLFDNDESVQMAEMNNRLKSDLMSHCLSFVRDNDEGRLCLQRVWKKYLRHVGDVSMLAAFFDTLPLHVKKSALPRYQEEIIHWCNDLFHFDSDALLCSIYYSETFQRVIRYALAHSRTPRTPGRKAMIYVSMDFDPNLIVDLTSTFANVKFEHVRNDPLHEDLIDITQLEEFIQRDVQDDQVYPAMVIANAGTALLGRCDDLTKIKSLCEQHDLWLHVIGDLLASLAVLPADSQANMTMNCDSLTLDIIKLFGIQNLPYVTFFLRRSNRDASSTDLTERSFTSHPLYDYILHSPSISFLTVWSLSQRCSRNEILHHLTHSLSLSNQFLQRIGQMKTFRLINDDGQSSGNIYQRISSGGLSNHSLPKLIVVFRFEPRELPQTDNLDDFYAYVDLLNLWLFDKLAQEYPKMNLELLKSVHFQVIKADENPVNRVPAHAIRFAPLEYVLDNVESDDMLGFLTSLQLFSDILHATMTARIHLPSAVSNFNNLMVVPVTNWAGVGAVRYVPDGIQFTDPKEVDGPTSYQIDSIQAELARKLQNKDSAFSLGGATEDSDQMFFLRLGMIKKPDDIKILLQKIVHTGKEVEESLKYVEDMAEKIKVGIEKVQKDLHDENLQLLVQGGILRQLPLVSNLMSWWSPPESATSLATKGRSYDLNTGRIESTEDIYTHRMQIQRHSAGPEMHNDQELSATPVRATANTQGDNAEQ